MSEKGKRKVSLKKASKQARNMLKKIAIFGKKKEIALSILVLAVGVGLGIVFDEFALFLAVAVAIDIVVYSLSINK